MHWWFLFISNFFIFLCNAGPWREKKIRHLEVQYRKRKAKGLCRFPCKYKKVQNYTFNAQQTKEQSNLIKFCKTSQSCFWSRLLNMLNYFADSMDMDDVITVCLIRGYDKNKLQTLYTISKLNAETTEMETFAQGMLTPKWSLNYSSITYETINWAPKLIMLTC